MSKKFDLEKSFIIPGTPENCPWHTIERAVYEGLPCAMIAFNWSDSQMQKLADAIGREFDYEDTKKTWEDAGCTADEVREEIDGHWWRTMEKCALELGMMYYEDLDEEDYKQLAK